VTSGSAGQPAGPELFEVPDIANSTKGLVLLMLTCVACIEARAQDLGAALRTCSAIESERDRLDCFDALARDALHAGRVAPPSSLPPAGPAASVPAPPSAPAAAGAAAAPTAPPAPPIATQPTPRPEPPPVVSTADFGLEHRTSIHPSGETLSATLALVESSGYGQLRVTLDNGQVWEQVGSDRYQLKVGDAVIIERGRFNSFFLRKQSSDRKVRFTRLN
jgi:hypothetical protein